MLKLHEIPFYAVLKRDELLWVEKAVITQSYKKGDIICRKGEAGQFFYTIAAGGVRVLLSDPKSVNKAIYLGPGAAFGEMSLLTAMPVSTHVIAGQDSVIYVLSKDSFFKLLSEYPALNEYLLKLLCERLRDRSALQHNTSIPACVFLTVDEITPTFQQFSQSLFQWIAYYIPGSLYVEWLPDVLHSENRPPRLHESEIIVPLAETVDHIGKLTFSPNAYRIESQDLSPVNLIRRWRSQPVFNQLLVFLLSYTQFKNLASELHQNDTVIHTEILHQNDEELCKKETEVLHGRTVGAQIVTRRLHQKPGNHRWRYLVPLEQLDVRNFPTASEKRTGPDPLQSLARYICRREIGTALGSGAARGFAHLGVLKAMEDHGIFVDYACGTSMGGIISVIYGLEESADHAIELARDAIGSNQKVRDWALLPTASFFSGRKVQRAALNAFGTLSLSDLRIPTSTISADLVSGKQVIMESGSAASAVLSTSAIPGLYPPIYTDNQVLVDGALISRIPVDVLSLRGCGIKIGVSAAPDPEISATQVAQDNQEIIRQCKSFLGFRTVMARSWDLIAWWHGNRDLAYADILIVPDIHKYPSFDFDCFDRFIEIGIQAAELRMETLLNAAQSMSQPGTP
jgi:predicted acylesterase/phospholipase RssA/CRP-like cAMP-binding protein